MRKASAIGGWLASTVVPAPVEEKLKVPVRPIESLAPSTVNIRARLDPGADNRMLTIVVDSADFHRSRTIPLNREPA